MSFIDCGKGVLFVEILSEEIAIEGVSPITPCLTSSLTPCSVVPVIAKGISN